MFTYNNFDKILGLEKADRLLLKNLLQNDNKEITANEFCNEFDLWNIDYEQFALMPAFYMHNAKIKYDNNVRIRIRGIYNYLMCKNASNLKLVLKLIHELNKNGIKVLLLKGIVLCHKYYKSLAMRRMEDIDIAVMPKDFDKAVKIAENLGWHGINAVHSIDLKFESVGAVDLHYVIYKENYKSSNKESCIWDNLEEIVFYGEKVYVMNTEDMFFSVMLNEFLDIIQRPVNLKKMKWLLDINKILQVKKELDINYIFNKIQLFGVEAQFMCLLNAYNNITANKDKNVVQLLGLLHKNRYTDKRLKLFNKLYLSSQENKIVNYKRAWYLFEYVYPDAGISNIFEFKEFLYKAQNIYNFKDFIIKNSTKYLKRVGDIIHGK